MSKHIYIYVRIRMHDALRKLTPGNVQHNYCAIITKFMHAYIHMYIFMYKRRIYENKQLLKCTTKLVGAFIHVHKWALHILYMYIHIYVHLHLRLSVKGYYTLIGILFHGRLNNRMQWATGLAWWFNDYVHICIHTYIFIYLNTWVPYCIYQVEATGR